MAVFADWWKSHASCSAPAPPPILPDRLDKVVPSPTWLWLSAAHLLQQQELLQPHLHVFNSEQKLHISDRYELTRCDDSSQKKAHILCHGAQNTGSWTCRCEIDVAWKENKHKETTPSQCLMNNKIRFELICISTVLGVPESNHACGFNLQST